ncbi:MAG: hypothetical protein ABJB98_02940 [Actinomycetota bacterium]
MTAVALLLLAGGGHGLLRVTMRRPPSRAFGVAPTMALSVLAGAAVIGVLTTLCGVTQLSTRLWPALFPAMLLLCTIGVLPSRAAKALNVDRHEDSKSMHVPQRPPIDWLFLAVAAIAAVLLSWGTSAAPVISNDEYAIWAVRGRALWMMGRLDPAIFLGANADFQHLDYPLGVPALISWGDQLAGHVDDGSAHILLISLIAAMLAVVGWALNALAGPLAGIGGTLLVAGTPGLLSKWGVLLMADTPQVAFAVSLVLMLAVWVRRGGGDLLVVAAVMGAGALATKVEGALFVVAAFAAALAVAPGGRAARRPVLISFGAAVASAIPWAVWTHAHHLENDLINGETLSIDHVRRVIGYGALAIREIGRYWPGHGWLLVAATAVVCLLAATVPAARGPVGVVIVAWLLSCVGLWAQYVIAAGRSHFGALGGRELQAHFASSASRVLLTPAVLLMVLLPLAAGLTWAGRRSLVRVRTPEPQLSAPRATSASA